MQSKRITRRLLSFLATLTVVPFLSLTPAHTSAAPGTGTLLGTDAIGGHLIAIDVATGGGRIIGSLGFPAPALAMDPTTGNLYAGQGAGLPLIYRVNPTTGVRTLVGNTGLGIAAVSDLAFAADGTLYAAVNIVGDGGTGGDNLALINKTTGVATVIGPFGTEGIEALAFDAAGTLWAAKSIERGVPGNPGLYTINPATGAATFVAPILDASGTAPSRGVVSLQFACDGTLYGGTARAATGAADGGRLITIDPATGRFAFVGSLTAAGSLSLAALTFQDPCREITAPTCALTNVGFASGRTFIQVTVQDTGSGLAAPGRIEVTEQENVLVSPALPLSLPLDHRNDVVVITATKNDQTQLSRLALRVTDAAGNVTSCDPVLTTVGRDPDNPPTTTLRGIPRAEHKITIHNGTPGLKGLQVLVNGVRFRVQDLRDGEVRTLDVASAMRPGSRNTISLRAQGKRNTDATVLVSD